MSKMETKYKEVYSYQFESELKDLWGYEKFDKYIQDKIVEHLFGMLDRDPTSKFKVVYKRNPYIKTNTIQRINLFWVWPLWLVIAPIKWIVTGEMGVTKDSKVGKILTKLIGNY